MRVKHSAAKSHDFAAPEILRRTCLYSRVLVWLYGFVLSTNCGWIMVVHAQLGGQGSRVCRINDVATQILSYDAGRNSYILLDDVNATINQNTTRRQWRLSRHLRNNNHYFQKETDDSVAKNRALELQIPEENEFIQVYECDCASRFQEILPYSFYCPTNKHYCSVSRSSTPLCIDAPTASSYLAVNLKLFAISSLTVLIVWLVVSPRGHHTLAFCASFLCPCYFTDWYLNFLIKHRPTRVSKILRGWIEERQDRLESRYRELQRLNGDVVPESSVDVTSPPLNAFEESLVREIYECRPSLVLKTRLYKKGPSDSCTATFSHIATGSSADDLSSHVKSTIDTDSFEPRVTRPVDHLDMSLVDVEKCKDDLDESSRHGCDRDDSCMICFATVLEGERVGIMPSCDHIFHSKCLKDWLKRRNVCPLCLDENVAVFSSSPRLKKSQTQQEQLADERQGNASISR